MVQSVLVLFCFFFWVHHHRIDVLYTLGFSFHSWCGRLTNTIQHRFCIGGILNIGSIQFDHKNYRASIHDNNNNINKTMHIIHQSKMATSNTTTTTLATSSVISSSTSLNDMMMNNVNDNGSCVTTTSNTSCGSTNSSTSGLGLGTGSDISSSSTCGDYQTLPLPPPPPPPHLQISQKHSHHELLAIATGHNLQPIQTNRMSISSSSRPSIYSPFISSSSSGSPSSSSSSTSSSGSGGGCIVHQPLSSHATNYTTYQNISNLYSTYAVPSQLLNKNPHTSVQCINLELEKDDKGELGIFITGRRAADGTLGYVVAGLETGSPAHR